MEETIKCKEVIAYKGMNSDMTCRGFQYEIGNPYKTDKAELCNCGFHACLNPRDVLDYYSHYRASRYFKVKLSGKIAKCGNFDTKVAATEITILEEITDNFNKVIETTEWWKNDGVLDLLCYSAGFAKIERGDYLYSFIDKNGKYLSDEWFYGAYSFNQGFAIIQRRDYLFNLIDNQGKLLSDEWFKDANYFNEGFAKVRRGDELWNFIDKNGIYLSDEWFRWVHDFHKGLAIVRRSDWLFNYIDKNGNYLSDEWFKDAYYFHKGLAKVQKTNNCWYEIDTSGKVVNSVHIS